jgi:uncharacterized membrane protein
VSREVKETIIYFITNKNLTNDGSVLLFNRIYNSYGITSNSLNVALVSFAVDFINSSFLISEVDMGAIKNRSQVFTPGERF